jgi:salicylate hydroxylase
VTYPEGDLFSIVAFLPTHLLRSPEPRDNSTRSWGQTGSTAELAGYYADWHPSIAALARVTPIINVYPDYHGPALPSLVVGDGRVVLIGDAGHPHGGAFAAGGTLSIEDAYTLSLCLAHATSTSHSHATDTDANTAAPAPEVVTACRVAGEKGPRDRNPNPKEWVVCHAFELFDACRRDHVNKLVAAADRLRAQRRADEGRMLSDEEIIQRVHRRQDVGWLAENDAEKVFREVVAKRGCGDTKN